jgi:hypothetical protein
MKWSELTGLRLKQILSGGKTVVQCTSNLQTHLFWLDLGLGWVFAATEGYPIHTPITRTNPVRFWIGLRIRKIP